MDVILYCFGGFACLIILIIVGFRIAVRRGGRKVQAFDPNIWIIQPKVDSEVIRRSDDSLIVRWDGKPDQTEIYIAADPTDPDNWRLEKTVIDQNQATFTDLDPGTRFYFKLRLTGDDRKDQELVVGERFLPLESVNNLRDIGGYRTADGQTIRWGMLYRTGNLARLNGVDMGYLQALGTKLVCDLRSTATIEKSPDRLPAGSGYFHTPIYEDEFNQELFPVMLFRRHLLGENLAAGYSNWPQSGALAFGKFFEKLTDPDNFPMLYHCTAGKDRAGIATAILLSLLGVPDETIIADYSLTNLMFDRLYQEFVEDNRVEKLGIPNSDIKIMLAANPEWIKDTLDLLNAKFGGAAGYLLAAADVSQDTIDSIRMNLLSA